MGTLKTDKSNDLKRLWLHWGEGMEHNITYGSALWLYKWGTLMKICTTEN